MLQSVVPTLQRPVQSGNTQHINLSPGSRLPRNKSYYFLQVNFKEEEAFVSRLLLGADQYQSFKPPQTRLSPQSNQARRLLLLLLMLGSLSSSPASPPLCHQSGTQGRHIPYSSRLHIHGAN